MDDTARRFDQLQHLFDTVVELPPGDQDDFARASCAHDAQMYTDLCDLLRQERRLARASTASLFGALDLAMRQALPDSVRPGSRLGAFTIREQIGSGGM